MRFIEWAPDGVDSLNKLLDYYLYDVDRKLTISS